MLLVPLAVAVAVFALAAWVFERRGSRGAERRIEAYVSRRVATPAADPEALAGASRRPLDASARHLRGLPGWARLERTVERADLRVSAVELFWIVVGGTLLLLALAAAAGVSPVELVLLVLLEALVLRICVSILVQRRRRKFDEQLPEFLSEIASALRAGHGFNQALLAVTADAPEPTRKEFERVLNETRLGRSLEDALVDLGRRVESPDLDFVIDAILVQRQVGGSLAGIFTIVSESVRQRHQFALRVRSLTAMGRISALTVLALPVVVATLLTLMNHSYLVPLFENGGGRMFLVGSGLLLLFAGAWLRKLVSAAR
jgi:tight adherence protein B